MPDIRTIEDYRDLNERFDSALTEYGEACSNLKSLELGHGEGSWVEQEARRSAAADKCRAAFEDVLARIAVLS